jgi:hypothetical protein
MSDYDVVVDVLQKHRDNLMEMVNRNLRSELIGINIMDEIRLNQIDQLDEAIALWRNRNE